MIDFEQKQEIFIKRAQGKSYAKIAEELKISKPTVIKYIQESPNTLANLVELEKDDLAKSLVNGLKVRTAAFDSLYSKVMQDLLNRNLDSESITSLFKILEKIEVQMNKLETTSFTVGEDLPF